MALKRVTIQDIADACGLSRNTVSKVFNNRGAVPESTRKLVMQKAQALGYGMFSEEDPSPARDGRVNIALLTQPKLLSHSFGAFFITSFTDQVCRAGYNLKIYEISPREIAEKRLPPHLLLEETAGFLGIELFDREYQAMICSLGIPCVFVDGHARLVGSLLNCDCISMENVAASAALTERLIAAGAKEIGFVGDKAHCSSFYMRWLGCRTALEEAGLTLSDDCSILAEDGDHYGDADWLLSQLDRMPRVPDAFVCANDYLAIHLMTALKRKGLSIPGDVMVTGFDGSPESAVVEPALTTAAIPSTDIGRGAAITLFSRINNPNRPHVFLYYKTTPIFRASTR